MTVNEDLTIYKGATFVKVFTWLNEDGAPVDLTDYSARMDVRSSAGATTRIFQLSDDVGELVLGGILGTITLTIEASDTADVTECEGVYDLELVSDALVVTRTHKGKVYFVPEVTR